MIDRMHQSWLSQVTKAVYRSKRGSEAVQIFKRTEPALITAAREDLTSQDSFRQYWKFRTGNYVVCLLENTNCTTPMDCVLSHFILGYMHFGDLNISVFLFVFFTKKLLQQIFYFSYIPEQCGTVVSFFGEYYVKSNQILFVTYTWLADVNASVAVTP